MTECATFRLAAIQTAPVYFDREASTEKACKLIEQAGVEGATIAAFGETWLPGYPFYLWTSKFDEDLWRAAAKYLENAVEIPSPTTDRLCASAKAAGIDVVIGVAERDAETKGTAKAACDVAGHYSRPDIFQLRVNRSPHRRVVEMEDSSDTEAGSVPEDETKDEPES